MRRPRTWLTTSRRFQAGEPVRARPVGTTERVIVWCRRKPSLRGSACRSRARLSGRQLRRSLAVEPRPRARRPRQQNAVAFRRERDTAALGEGARRAPSANRPRSCGPAEAAGERPAAADRGCTAPGRPCWRRPSLFTRNCFPTRATTPSVRREAAQLFGQVAEIHHTLDQAAKAAEAWGRQASLLTSLLAEEPASKALRMHLADSLSMAG